MLFAGVSFIRGILLTRIRRSAVFVTSFVERINLIIPGGNFVKQKEEWMFVKGNPGG